MSQTCFLLTDNGSFRPEATFSLRLLAEKLSARVGQRIHPVSLLHSDKVKPSKLEGVPAETFEPFVERKRQEGFDQFMVTPMFFGPSAAIMDYIPRRVETLRSEAAWPELEVRIAPCVVNIDRTEDNRMAQILADQIDTAQKSQSFQQPAVALVDHGSPLREVAAVRDFLAEQVRQLLPEDRFPLVKACSMERREGEEYDFNEPLLERVIGAKGFQDEVIVSMLFASPGRHAGSGGDVAQICEKSAADHANLRWCMTDLVAKHGGLIDLLAERFEQGLQSKPVSWAPSIKKTG